MSRLLLLLLLAFTTLPAAAWNAAGHRLIVHLAWQQLSPETQGEVAALLAEHPDAGRWSRAAADQRQLAAEAANWPDDIRGDPRFTDDGQRQTAPVPGFADPFRHRDWHYVDRTLGEDGRPRTSGALDRQLDRLLGILADRRASRADKAYALPWVLHLVGDIHQPLHVGCRPDEGGNRFDLSDPAHPRLPITNLHRWWDDLAGPPWLRGKALERAAERLAAAHPPTAVGNVGTWRDESGALCRSAVYPPEPQVTPEYRAAAQRLADRRLVEAGHRLAEVLERSLAPVPRETGR